MKTTHFKMILACLVGLIIFTTTFSNPFDEPSKPGTPEAVDWGADFIKIKWDAPVNDGGFPILYYEVEMKEKYSQEWIKVDKVPGDLKVATILGTEGSEVQFRVIAVNVAGQSEPSEPTQILIFKR